MKKTLFALIVLVGALTGTACGQPSSSLDPKWQKLSAAYADPGTAPAVTSAPEDNPDAVVEHITFTDGEGSLVKGIFVRPKADGVYPVLVMLHGLGGSKNDLVKPLTAPLIAKGIAIFALDAPNHGERRNAEGGAMLMKMFFAAQKSQVKGDLVGQVQSMDADHSFAKFFAHMVHEGVQDYRLGLDYLATRKDVDAKHIGLMGYSMGSIMGSILIGVDSRITMAALCVGGDPIAPEIDSLPAELRESASEIACSFYVGHGACPLFMLNGNTDQTIPRAATDRLYEAAKQPKEIKWYDSGHLLPKQALEDAVGWSISHLKA